ncbi:MAG: acyltransferase [Myxococcales bacterium]|nr:acyltransferase [Myxococcales bacterium]
MSRVVRVAMTETRNAYAAMPARVEELESLAGVLDDVRQANLEHHASLIERAVSMGARIVGLGELFPAPYFALEQRALWRGFAEDAVTGPTSRFMAELAKRLGVVIVAPIYELEPGGKRFNTALVLDEQGRLLGTYRKTHIPFGTNEIASFHENFYYDRADGEGFVDERCNRSKNPYFPVFQTSVGKLGVAICYDRHFEGVVRSLAEGGAEIVLCPAVSFGEKSQRMWQHEAATDALRHKLFIGASNRRGAELPWTVEYFGDSYFVGPNGRCANESSDPELIVAALDLGSLDGADGSGWNIPRDTRSDIYS